MIWSPLTYELAVKRMVALSYAVEDRNGPIEEVLLQVVRCDECGATVDFTDLWADVSGWLTTGHPHDGFKDVCPACAANAHLTPSPSERV